MLTSSFLDRSLRNGGIEFQDGIYLGDQVHARDMVAHICVSDLDDVSLAVVREVLGVIVLEGELDDGL
jgi:hypothetical protein